MARTGDDDGEVVRAKQEAMEPDGEHDEQDHEQDHEHDDLPPHRKRHQRHLLACVECRRIKTRCLGNEDQVSTCQRCQRLGLSCVYARKRRRKAPDAEPPQSNTYRMPNRTRALQPASGVTDVTLDGMPSSLPAAGVVADSLPPLSRIPSGIASGSSSVSLAAPVMPAASAVPSPSPPSPTATPVVDIRHFLEPPLAPQPRMPVPPPQAYPQAHMPQSVRIGSAGVGGIGEDPLALKLVSWEESLHLRSLYMEQLNPLIGTLDPELHTHTFLRAAPLLLSALLTVSAKYFLQRRYPSLLQHTRSVVNRAVGDGRATLGLVQALILLITWKEPHDSSSWVKLGVAIRLGYQLGMHVRRRTPLPENEDEARRVADRERTWYTLSSFDRLYSDIYSLPPTVQLAEIPDAEAWAAETARLRCGDDRHACSYSSAATYRMWVAYRRQLSSMPRPLAREVLDDLYAQIDGHLQRWLPDDPAKSRLTPFEQTYLKWFDLNHMCKIKYLMIDLEPEGEPSAAVLDWLLLAEHVTEQTEALGALGTLRFMQDTNATHISAFGVMVYNLFPRFTPAQKRLGLEYVRRLSAACDAAIAPDIDGESVVCFVGRFTRRLRAVLDAAVPPIQDFPQPQAVLAEPSDGLRLPELGHLDLDDFFRSILQNGTGTEGGDGWWLDPGGMS